MIDWEKINKVRDENKSILMSDKRYQDSCDILYCFDALEELRTELQMVQDERNWLRRQLEDKSK